MINKKLFILCLFLLLIFYYCFIQESVIKIVFVGDIMLSNKSANNRILDSVNTPGNLIDNGGDPFENFSNILANSDLSIGNLECCITTSNKPRKKAYKFKANENCLPLLKKYFDVVSIANNHTYDYGESGFLEMIELFNKYSLPYIGGGVNLNRAIKPKIFNIKNVKIAVISFDNSIPSEISRATDEKSGNLWATEESLTLNINRIKNKYKPDYLILFIHWGIEYDKIAQDPEQLKLGFLAIDLGVDIVVGHHPHVTQNVTIYKNKPIFYSLGNFIFHGFADKEGNAYDPNETSQGWVLECFLTPKLKLSWNIHKATIGKDGVPKYSGVL